MEPKYFPLDESENNRYIKLIKLVFGFTCAAIAIFWMIFNVSSQEVNKTSWVTILFLAGFGVYQILSGLGRTKKFIEIGSDSIILKTNPISPAVNIKSPELKKIELYPLNVIFYLKSEKKIYLRFGTTFYATNEQIKDCIIDFAELKNVPFEIVKENL